MSPVACWYDRPSWGSRSGGTTTASQKEEESWDMDWRVTTVASAHFNQIQIRRTRHGDVARSDNHAFGSSRSDLDVSSLRRFRTASKYSTTHSTCAVGYEGNGSLRKARVCQPCWEHQGPPRLLDPQAGGRAR